MANSVKWLNTITLLSLCVMIFTLPFSKSMLEIFFTVMLVSWVLGRILSYKSGILLADLFRPVSTPLNLPLYLFALLGFLSIFVSPSIFLSLRAFFSKFLKVIIFYFIIVETVDSKKKVAAILITFLFSAIITGSDGIFQLIRGIDFIRQYPLMSDRVTGSFNNQNNLAAWLTIVVPLSSCLLYFSSKSLSKKIRPLLFFLTLILIVCLVLTYTRGAWIAVMLSLILTGILKSKKLAIITILTVTLLFYFSTKPIKERTVSIAKGPELAASLLFSSSTKSIKERTLSIPTGSGSEVHRAILWQEAVAIIKDFPFLGCGLNTYSIVAPKYKIAEGGGIYPHNSYLQMAAETGLLGLGAFLWIIITVFKTSWGNLKKINDKFYNALSIGLLAGLFAFLAHSFVDTNFYSLQFRYLMWFVIGLIVAVQRIALKEESEFKRI